MEKKEIDLEKLKELYETKDVTLDYIANELGCSRSLVKIKVRHLKLKKFSKYDFITKEVLEELYIKQNLSMKQVADKLNIKKGDIQKKVDKFKLNKGTGDTYDISKQELVDLLKKGYSAAKIAKEMNCSEYVILNRLKRYNIKPERRKYNIGAEELRKLYLEDKLPIHKIAQIYKCSDIIIQNRLKEFGLRNEKGISRINIDEELLRKYVSEGLTYQEIANKMNLDRSTVANKSRKLGLKHPKSKIQKATYEELYDLYINKGISRKEIGGMYGCTMSNVGVTLNKLGIRKEDKQKSNELKNKATLPDKEIKKLYLENNMSPRSIRKQTGVPENYIFQRIRAMGILKEDPWKFVNEDLLRDLYVNKNMNTPEIASKLGCPKSIICDKIYKIGLTQERTPEDHLKSIHRSYQNSTTRSQGEIEICEMYPTEYINNHDVINWELDLWYPESKVAIEYNGEYWHSSATHKPGKHIAKTTICDNRGIHLINIFERFWKNREYKAKIINILSNTLKPEELKIPEGEIDVVNKEEAQDFIRRNNVEKVIPADFHIGTYNKQGVLVNMLSVKQDGFTVKIRRFTTQLGYKEDYSKLIEYLKEEYNPAYLEVSCDRRYYNGREFKELGFKVVNVAKAEYEYVKGSKVISRVTYSKSPDKYKSYYKVYDCGRLKLRLEA